MFGLDLTPEQHDLAGNVVHYGIGVAPAAAYALVRDELPVQGPARGLLYGLGLFWLKTKRLMP
jgi:hypothetical protein